jgi:hypothetical protein
MFRTFYVLVTEPSLSEVLLSGVSKPQTAMGARSVELQTYLERHPSGHEPICGVLRTVRPKERPSQLPVAPGVLARQRLQEKANIVFAQNVSPLQFLA